MKENFKLYHIGLFLIFLGKVLLDTYLFISHLPAKDNHDFLLEASLYTLVFSLLSVLIFNYVQRSYTYSRSFIILCLWLLVPFYFFYSRFVFFETHHAIALAIANYFLLLLFCRGMNLRIAESNLKSLEKSTHIAALLGIGIAATYFIITLRFPLPKIIYLKPEILFPLPVILGLLLIMFHIIRHKNSRIILDNIQEIRVQQRFYHLCLQKYFRSIFFITALTSCILFITIAFFIHIISVDHPDTPKFSSVIPNIVVSISLTSILYELFLKKRVFFQLSLKTKLAAISIVIFVFSLIQIVNTWYFKVDTQNELYFFVPIFSALFIFFLVFAGINLFYPTLNTLFLPLAENNLRDYYIKSAFFGFTAGIGVSALILKYGMHQFQLLNYTEYSIVQFVLALISIIIIWHFIYKNYKKTLHKKLYDNRLNKTDRYDFFEHIQNLFKVSDKDNSTILANLLYILNPYRSKKIFESLITNGSDHFQGIGLVYSNQLLLIESIEKVKDLTTSKYYASSSNRDYIDSSLNTFEDIFNRMRKETYIPQLSISKIDEERLYAALLCEQRELSETCEILKRLLKDDQIRVLKQAIVSASNINDLDITKQIVEKLDQSFLSNAAFASLINTQEDHLIALEESFYETGQNEKTQIKIVQILGEIASPQAIKYLFPKVNYTNQKVITAALKALSKCETELPKNEELVIKHELEEVCRYLIWNSSLLLDLKKTPCSQSLTKALKTEIEFNYKSLFDLLNLLYSAQSIQLIQENLNSRDYERRAFAIELAAVVLKDEMKPIILPLLQPISMQEQVKSLQKHFCTESMSKTKVLYDIIQRDYKWISPWTKACALKELAENNKIQDIPLLLANMVNPDPLLAEIAARSVFIIDRDIYQENKRMLGRKYKGLISAEAMQIIESSSQSNRTPRLKADIIEYLQNVPKLANIPGEILKLLTDCVHLKKMEKNETICFNVESPDYGFYYVIYSGSIDLYVNSKLIATHKELSFVSHLDLLPVKNDTIELVADSPVVYYDINPDRLNEFMHTYPEISLSILKEQENSDNKKTKKKKSHSESMMELLCF